MHRPIRSICAHFREFNEIGVRVEECGWDCSGLFEPRQCSVQQFSLPLQQQTEPVKPQLV